MNLAGFTTEALAHEIARRATDGRVLAVCPACKVDHAVLRFTGGTNARCSFCAHGTKDTAVLIAGPAVYICDHCVQLCNGILAEQMREVPSDE